MSREEDRKRYLDLYFNLHFESPIKYHIEHIKLKEISDKYDDGILRNWIESCMKEDE